MTDADWLTGVCHVLVVTQEAESITKGVDFGLRKCFH